MGKKKTSMIKNNDNKLNKNIGNSKRIVLIIVTVLLLTVAVGIIGSMTTSASNNLKSSSQNITGDWMDVHGIGVISTGTDNNSLYLATHNGLFIKTDKNNNSSNWIEVGNDKSDLMGFIINPNKQDIMYSSGHPQTGGNLGFRISNDYGVTWEKVSDVTTPNPIDFHTMTVGANPNIIYGASGMGDRIYFSQDDGKIWNTVNPPTDERIVTLAANQTNSNNIYAATTNGIFSSTNQGENWQKINNELFNQKDTMVTGIEISPDGKTTFAFVAPNQSIGEEEGYIIKSTDGAKTWTKTNGQISGAQFVSKFAFGNNGNVYVALIQNSEKTGVASSLYSSNDNGKTWIIEGTNNKILMVI